MGGGASDKFIDSLTFSFTIIYSLIDLLAHAFIHSFTPIIYLLIHSVIDHLLFGEPFALPNSYQAWCHVLDRGA